METNDGKHTIDKLTGKVIRPTDNSMKDGDLDAPNQDPVPLELDQNGIPVGLTLPGKG